VKLVLIISLIINVIVSVRLGYGKVFCSKEIIEIASAVVKVITNENKTWISRNPYSLNPCWTFNIWIFHTNN
jgi:hypothetical protein